MDPLKTMEIGKTGLYVTQLGYGAASLGGLYKEVTTEKGVLAARRALDLGINYFDVAPFYGYGMAEERLGQALANRSRDSFVLSSKVGRLIKSVESPDPNSIFKGTEPRDAVFDFSRDGILRSIEDSLKRLQMDHIDILFIHDPDQHYKQAILLTFLNSVVANVLFPYILH